MQPRSSVRFFVALVAVVEVVPAPARDFELGKKVARTFDRTSEGDILGKSNMCYRLGNFVAKLRKLGNSMGHVCPKESNGSESRLICKSSIIKVSNEI